MYENWEPGPNGYELSLRRLQEIADRVEWAKPYKANPDHAPIAARALHILREAPKAILAHLRPRWAG